MVRQCTSVVEYLVKYFSIPIPQPLSHPLYSDLSHHGVRIPVPPFPVISSIPKIIVTFAEVIL